MSKLERIPVAGGNETLVAVFSATGGKCAENIVCLPALALYGFYSQKMKKIFDNRHLRAKLVGHCVSACLVGVIHFMPECRGVNIKRNGNGVG